MKNKKAPIKILIITLCMIFSTVNIVLTDNISAGTSPIDYPGEDTRYIFANSTASFEITGPATYDVDIWIEEVIINNDDEQKYQPLEDFVYFTYKEYSNTPIIKSQKYNFKTDSNVGFYIGGPNGPLYRRVFLKVNAPDDAAQDTEIIVKIKEGDYKEKTGYISFESTTIVNNGIWNYEAYPGTWNKYGRFQESTHSIQITPDISGISYSIPNIVWADPFDGFLGGSPDPSGYDPYETYYIWFGSNDWDSYNKEWVHTPGPLNVRTPLNSSFGEYITIALGNETIYITINETHDKIYDKKPTFSSQTRVYGKVYCEDPVKTIRPGEIAIYNITVNDLFPGCIDGTKTDKYKNVKYQSTYYTDDGFRFSYNPKLQLLFPKFSYANPCWLCKCGTYHCSCKNQVLIKAPDELNEDTTLRTIIYFHWRSTGGKPHNNGYFRLVLLTKVETVNASLNVTKIANVTEGYPGDKVNYTITVSNPGEDPLYDVHTNDSTLGASFYLDELAGGESKTYYVEHILQATPDPFENCVTVEGYDEFGDYYSDTDCAIVDVLNLGISVDKKVKKNCCGDYSDSVTVEKGDFVTFKITVENAGETPLNITVTDKLPVKLIYDNHATPREPDNTIFPTDGTIHYIWYFEDVPPQTDIEITFQAIVNDRCTDLENIVEVTGTYEDKEVTDQDSAIVHVECPKIPCLEYTPHEYDFGCHEECEIDITSFNIWNGCEGVLEYEISWDCGWIQSLTPTSGTSTGEHDTITVQINTAGMYPGEYSCNITITSNGGNGTFILYLTVADNCPDPCLKYTMPPEHDFGTMNEGETAETIFEIWNSCGDTLDFTLSESASWLTVTPSSGTSTGDPVTISVDIDTTGLSDGTYQCDIQINSNGGSGVYTVYVTVENNGELKAPTVDLVNPENNTLYFRNLNITFPINLIIGSIDIEAEASDLDGDVVKVEFYIDDELMSTDTVAPYNWTWNERAIGLRTITAKAYDNDGLTAEDSLDVIIFNLARN